MDTLRYALRMLRKTPWTTLVAVLALALAIGASTAIFSAVNGVLLRPLPFPEADRLVQLYETHPSFPRMFVSYPDFLDWQRESKTFESMAATRPHTFNLTSAQPPERLTARMTSASYPTTLRFRPPLGRYFSAAEDVPGGPRVAVISHDLWQRTFAGAPDVLGRTLQLDGKTFEVIGVMPKGFSLDGGADAYVPLAQMDPEDLGRGNHPGILVVGRLARGATLERARQELEALGRALGREHLENRDVLPGMTLLREDRVKDVRGTLWVLLAAAGFVLLIAIANVANLMLARGIARRKELAVRAALGASRWALVRQLLVESALISWMGGALGVLIAVWALDLVGATATSILPVEGLSIDTTVLAFTLLVATLAGLGFGIVPARAGARVNVLEAMKDSDARSGESVRSLGTRRLLVGVEMAIALILLVGAGVTLRSFFALNARDPGFRPAGVTAAQVALTPTAYADGAAVRAFLTRLEEGARALPGVESVALSSTLPLLDSNEMTFTVAGRPAPPPGQRPFASRNIVSTGYFATMGIELVAGRLFTSEDAASSRPVVVIDERLAREFFPGEAPLGQRLNAGFTDTPVEIIGVVRHVAQYSLDGTGAPTLNQFYVPLAQAPDARVLGSFAGFHLTVRSGQSAEAVAPALRELLRRTDALAAVYDVLPMSAHVQGSLASQRLSATLLGLFAGFAFVIAVVGLYAVMAFLVLQRTHEIGVRMALGAQARQVEGMMVRAGARITLFGLGGGLLVALALGRAVASLLPGVDGADPLVFGATALVLAGAALLASYVPARRAARVDPLRALKAD